MRCLRVRLAKKGCFDHLPGSPEAFTVSVSQAHAPNPKTRSPKLVNNWPSPDLAQTWTQGGVPGGAQKCVGGRKIFFLRTPPKCTQNVFSPPESFSTPPNTPKTDTISPQALWGRPWKKQFSAPNWGLRRPNIGKILGQYWPSPGRSGQSPRFGGPVTFFLGGSRAKPLVN